jgi:hypothetical protein
VLSHFRLIFFCHTVLNPRATAFSREVSSVWNSREPRVEKVNFRRKIQLLEGTMIAILFTTLSNWLEQSERRRIGLYLGSATNHAELERRIRSLDKSPL